MVSTTTHETSTYPTLSNKPTTISSHGAVDHKALQVYGSGPIILRLGYDHFPTTLTTTTKFNRLTLTATAAPAQPASSPPSATPI